MKKYAIIKLTTLKVLSFDNKQELMDAANELKKRNIEMIVLKYVPELETHTQLEIY